MRQSDDKRPPSKATQRREGVSRRRAWVRMAIFRTKNKNINDKLSDKAAVASIVVFFYYICRKKRQI